jgi:hypothetical protein
VAEHSTESSHWIKFQKTEVMAKMSDHMDLIVKEATEIILHLNNINREEGFKLSESWNPSSRLLGHTNTTDQENLIKTNTGKSMLQRR